MKEAHRPPNQQPRLNKTIHILLFLTVMSFSSMAVMSLLPIYLENLGGSPGKIGFLMGLFSLASLISRPFVGWSLSRFNQKKVMIAGLGFQVVVTILYLFVDQLGWFITVVRIAHGISVSFFIVSALLIVVQVVSEKQRAYALGVVSAGFMLPLLVVPYIAEAIILKVGFSAFFIFALVFVAVPFIAVLFIRLDIQEEPEKHSSGGEGYFRLLTRRRIFSILCLTFVFEMALSAMLSFVPLLTVQISGMTAGVFYTCLGGMAVFMRLYVGRRFKFWGNTLLIIPAFLLLASGTLGVFYSQSSLFLGLSGLAWGLGTGILYPHLSAAVVHGLDPKARGKVLSIFAASVDLGFFAGPVIFGILSQSLGVRQAFFPFAGLIFLSSIVFMSWGGLKIFSRLPMPFRRNNS
jgi:predicted MFS family arabinose efflux permease